jgi:hypothetical protein
VNPFAKSAATSFYGKCCGDGFKGASSMTFQKQSFAPFAKGKAGRVVIVRGTVANVAIARARGFVAGLGFDKGNQFGKFHFRQNLKF